MKKVIMFISIFMIFFLVGCGKTETDDKKDETDPISNSESQVLSCINEFDIPNSYYQKNTTKYFFTGNKLVTISQEMVMTLSDESQYDILRSVWDEQAISLEADDEGGSVVVDTSYENNVYTMTMVDSTPNDRADGFNGILDDMAFQTAIDSMIEVHQAMNYTCEFE